MSFRKNAKNESTAYKMGISLLISAGIFGAVCLIASAIAYCTADPLSLIKPLSIAVLITSAAVASFVSSKKFGTSQSLISSLILTLLMLTVGIVASKGKMNTGALINYACYMATAALFSYLAGRTPKRKSRRRAR